MLIGVPRELLENESRVAATPKTVQQILKLGFDVIVEHDAGFKASFEDQAFLEAGAKIGTSAEIWQSDIIFKVNAPTDEEIAQMKEGATLVSFIWRMQNPELMKKLTEKKINVLAMDAVPRISRAQALDALSSMANISGYRAVIAAAHEFGSFFTGQITAAGKVPPAKVLVIGAGVAGLAAIGAANSLGAIVRAFDSRPEVKEQVQSMGASFLEIDFKEEGGSGDGYAKVMSEEFNRRAMELYAEQAKEVDIIITTAAIPGKPAPRLITKEMVDSINFPSRLPTQSSQLYGTNLVNLLKLLCKEKDGNINIDFEDVVLRGVTVVRDGEEIPPAQIQVSAQPKQETKATPVAEKKESKPTDPRVKYGVMAGVGVLFLWLASVAPATFLSHFTVFVLACVVGYYVVWNVSHALHTPLMAVTNAISGIIIVGALLQIRQPTGNLFIDALAFVAILVASINIFGGFRVTQRMLAMFRKG